VWNERANWEAQGQTQERHFKEPQRDERCHFTVHTHKWDVMPVSFYKAQMDEFQIDEFSGDALWHAV
jgi:hypothetical protein